MKAKFIALAALVLGMVSCQQDFDGAAQVGGEVDFQLAVAAPELAGTRADGDGLNGHNSAYGAIDYLSETDWANVDLRYTLEVYDAENLTADPVKDRMEKIVDKYTPVTFDLRLVPNRPYRFVVFADFVKADGTAFHVFGKTLQDITLANDAINEELTDAYFDFEDITVSNSAAQDMTLTRPFGKVRVIATDLAELNLNVNPGKVTVAYETTVPNKFNAVTGEIAAEATTQSFEFPYAASVSKETLADHYYTVGYDAMKNDKGEEGRHTHMTLFTDYILANEEMAPIQFTMTVYDKNGDKEENIIKTTEFNTDIPVQRNHLTTIVGNVLTTATEINVIIVDDFANGVYDAPYYNELWDGKTITEPACENNVYTIKVPSELAWLAQEVNKGNTFEGATFNVVANLDLNNEPWTPIGHGEYFRGTFNGNNHTIANLFYHNTDTADWCVGLFGLVDNATIKDINFVDANVYAAGGWAAALVGVVSGNTTIENIKVSGLVQIEGKMDYDQAGYIGVIVGGDLDGSHVTNINNITINVAEDSYVKGNQQIGGVVGTTNNVLNLSNIESNINVIAQTGIVGGIIGRLQHNSVVTNCVCSGDVTRLTAEGQTENQYKRIGAIAGTWENTVGKVELTDVEYTGTLNAGNDMTTFDYAGYVGRDLNTKDSATGRIFINGCEWVAYNKVTVNSAETLDSALDFTDVEIVVTEKIEYVGKGFEINRDATIDFDYKELNAGSTASSYWYALEIYNSVVNIKNANFTRAGIFAGENANVVFENGTINHKPERTSRYIFCAQSGATITVKDGTFKNDRAKNSFFWADAATIIVEGGNFGGVASNNKVVTSNGGQVIIKGGKFNFDPTAWLAEGYTATKSGSTWTVSAM